jgi:hypothetical protein
VRARAHVGKRRAVGATDNSIGEDLADTLDNDGVEASHAALGVTGGGGGGFFAQAATNTSTSRARADASASLGRVTSDDPLLQTGGDLWPSAARVDESMGGGLPDLTNADIANLFLSLSIDERSSTATTTTTTT